MFWTLLIQQPSLLIDGATHLLDYGIAGILVLTLLLWFFERRETMRRFERVMIEGASADLAVAKALESVLTVLTIHGWSTKNDDHSGN